jgi:hypothetical protein
MFGNSDSMFLFTKVWLRFCMSMMKSGAGSEYSVRSRTSDGIYRK